MNKNELNNFDELLKGKLDELQPAFDSKSWERLEKQLPKKAPKAFYRNPWIIGGVAAATVAALSVSLWSPSGVVEKIAPEHTEQVKEISKNNSTIPNEISTKEAVVEKEENDEIKTRYQEAEYIINTPKDTKETLKENKSSETQEVEDVVKEPAEIANTDQETQNLDHKSTTSDIGEKQNQEFSKEDDALVVVAQPKSDFTTNTNEGCLGTVFKFSTEAQQNVDYLWNFGDGNYSKEMNPSHKYEESGAFIVNLIVRSKIDNSVLSKSADQLMQVYATPIVSFSDELIDNQGIPQTSFINTTDKALNWSWNFGDGSISKEKDPYHSFRNKGMYAVSLTATNSEGCAKTYSKKIIVNDDYNLLAPNSFTPNGDGLNDYFMPVALEILDVSFSMSIISSTEGLIYESKNVNDKWDGSNQQNGSQCVEGSYMWIVKLINANGETEQYKGAILLLK